MAFFSPLESQTISVGDRDLMNACILEEVSFLDFHNVFVFYVAFDAINANEYDFEHKNR